MRRKDTDYLYSTTRVRSLERSLLNQERIDRMLDAKTFESAAKVLTELGYAEIAHPNLAGVERVLAQDREDSYALLRSISPDPLLIDVFSIKYDYHNIKTILKADATGADARRLLINVGRIPASSLESSLRQMEYRDMPPIMRQAVEDARETLARTSDPQLADFILDRACFLEMRRTAQQSGSRFLIGYVELLIDVTNLRTVVRAARQGKSAEFLRSAVLEGGAVSTDALAAAASAQTTVRDLFASTRLEAAAEAGALALTGETDFIRFERLCDDAVMAYLQSARFVAFGEAPIAAYLAAKEADITAVRIIMTGKLGELPPEEIRDRLRLTYV